MFTELGGHDDEMAAAGAGASRKRVAAPCRCTGLVLSSKRLWCSFLEADSVDPDCGAQGTVPNLRAVFMTLTFFFLQVIAVAAGSPLTLTAFLGAYIVRKKLGLLYSGAHALAGACTLTCCSSKAPRRHDSGSKNNLCCMQSLQQSCSAFLRCSGGASDCANSRSSLQRVCPNQSPQNGSNGICAAIRVVCSTTC